MAMTVTERGYDGQASSAADLTFSAFTPAAGSMLVCVINGGGTLTVNGITGHTGGAAWSRVAQVLNWGGTGFAVNMDFEVWACFVGGSPSSAGVTIDINYADIVMASLFEVTGADTSGTVANAFGVMGQENGYDLEPWEVTLAAFASATNTTFAVLVQNDSTPNTSWLDGTFTVGTQRTQNSYQMQAAWLLDTEDNLVRANTDNQVNAILWATEIKASGGGGGGGEVSSTPLQSLGSGFGPARAARLNGVIQ